MYPIWSMYLNQLVSINVYTVYICLYIILCQIIRVFYSIIIAYDVYRILIAYIYIIYEYIFVDIRQYALLSCKGRRTSYGQR